MVLERTLGLVEEVFVEAEPLAFDAKADCVRLRLAVESR